MRKSDSRLQERNSEMGSSVTIEACPLCDRPSETVERRHMNTAYIKEESNYIICCMECFKQVQADWRDMWEEYYAAVL